MDELINDLSDRTRADITCHTRPTIIWTVGVSEGAETISEKTWAVSSESQDRGTRDDEVFETTDIAASYRITRKIASSSSKQPVIKRSK